VHFADIGEQQVKNIPTPVHAFHIEMRPDDACIEGRPAKRAGSAAWALPIAVAAVAVAALGVAAIVYLTALRPGALQLANSPRPPPAAEVPMAPPPMASTSAPAAAPSSSPAAAAAPASPQQNEALVPETIPFIPDRAREAVRGAYLPAADHKALAISTAPIGFSSGQADDATAESLALDMCQKRADALAQPRNASSMPSAIRSFTRPAIRPCRRCRG
jgi:adenylate cyclase